MTFFFHRRPERVLAQPSRDYFRPLFQGSCYKTSQLETLERHPETSRVKDNLHLHSSGKMKATDGESGWCMLEILSYNCVQKLSTGNLRVIYGKMCRRKTHKEHNLSVFGSCSRRGNTNMQHNPILNQASAATSHFRLWGQ